MHAYQSLHTKEPDWHQLLLFWSQLFCFAPSGSYLAAAAAFPLIKLSSESVTSSIHIYTHLCSKRLCENLCNFACNCTMCWEVLGLVFLGFRVSGFGVWGFRDFRGGKTLHHHHHHHPEVTIHVIAISGNSQRRSWNLGKWCLCLYELLIPPITFWQGSLRWWSP